MWLGVLRALAKIAEVLQGLSCPLVGALPLLGGQRNEGPWGAQWCTRWPNGGSSHLPCPQILSLGGPN